MKINNIKHINKGKILKTFSVEAASGIWIPNFRLMNGSKGQFISVPSTKNFKGEYENTVFIKKEVLEEIYNLVAGSGN